MIHRNRLIFSLFVMLCLIPAVVLAQDEQCLGAIQAAFSAAEQVCNTVGRNQACVGNPNVQAEPQTGFAPFSFSQTGDTINVREIQSLRTNLLNAGDYGISLLNLQAGLPDDAPEQNAMLLAFGDVEIQNAVSAADVPPTLDIAPTGNMNVRSGPSTEDAVVGTLNAFQTVTANGRLGDNSWLRVRLPDGTFGWLFAQLVTTTGDINTLDIVDSSGTPVIPRFGPMQSFAFHSGDAPCAGTPASGVLIQSPAEAKEVLFSINDVEVVISGTALIQAHEGVEMTVSALEGVVRVGASGVMHVLLPGTQVRIPLNANQTPAGRPLEPEPYDVAALPVDLLPRDVAIAPPLTPDQIADSGIPTPGEWVTIYTVLTFDCADGRKEVAERFRSNPLTLEVEQEGAAIVLLGTQERDDPPFATVTLVRTGAGYYTVSATLENAFGRQSQYEFKVYVLSPDRIEGVVIGLGGDCTTTGPFTAERITPVS